MKTLSKLCTLVISFMLILSLTPAAYAGFPNTGDHNIDNATGDHNIDNATADQLITAIAEHLDVPADKQTMIDLNIIDPQARIWDSEDIYFCEAYNILLPLYDIYPYPAFFYPDILPREDHTLSSACVEANIAAILTGLAEPSKFTNIDTMSENDLTTLIQRLETDDYTPLVAPTEMPDCIADMTWDFDSYGLRNIILIAEYELPEGWFDTFLADGWWIGTDIPEEYKESHSDAIGITVFGEQMLYFKTGYRTHQLVTHEFTHYAVNRLGISNDYLIECYEEGQTGALTLREYGWTNHTEYIAVFMERWIGNPDSRDTLSAQAPKTAALAQQLVDGFSDAA